MTKRTFIAIHVQPGAELLHCLKGLQHGLRNSRVNWVNPGSMHLTLRFIGNTTTVQIGEIVKRAPGIFQNHSPFELELSGLGKFGSGSNTRVIWAGINRSEELISLAKETNQLVRLAGFNGEEREFKPHVTLGRIKWLKEVDKLRSQLAEYSAYTFQQFTVNEVVFYESILKPAGPLYRPIQQFAFAG